MPRTVTKEQFFARVNAKYKGAITTDKTIYTQVKDRMTFTCVKHGDFEITGEVLVSKQTKFGCPECAKESKIKKFSTTTKEFITKAVDKYGDKFTYENTIYKNSHTNLKVTCKIHGTILVNPIAFLRDKAIYGCKKCSTENIKGDITLSQEEYLKRVNEKYDNKFDLSKTTYTGMNNKVIITCPYHGDIEVFAATLLDSRNKTGCRKCSHILQGKTRSLSTEKFIEMATAKYGNKFDYSKVVYPDNGQGKVTIICPDHGEFETTANNFLWQYTHGCPKCASETIKPKVSKAENSIREFILGLGVDTLQSDRKIIYPYELDIVIPSRRLAIEYCGIYWHSDKLLDSIGQDSVNRHINKLNMTNEAGYRLITIFEDEWIQKPEIVKQIIFTSLKLMSPTILGARNCKIKKVTATIASDFFNKFHIQGNRPATYYYALTYQDTKIAMISLGKKRVIYGSQEGYEVIRYATNPKYYVAGGLAKLMKHFVKETGFTEITSYIDRRWFTGTEYLKSGFEFVKYTDPGYYYVKGQQRFHRAQFQKHKLAEKLENFDPALTEKENMEANGYSRIYDCGQILVKYKPS